MVPRNNPQIFWSRGPWTKDESPSMVANFLVPLKTQIQKARESRLYARFAAHPTLSWLPAVLFSAVCIFVFLTARFSFDFFRHNDYDVLPYAKQYMNPDWLPGDWYLNLKIGYRYAFNTVAGFLSDHLSFHLTKTVGRTLVAGLMALSFTALQRSVRMYALLILPVIAYFVQEQSFFSDESFLLRFEAKCFAYGFALLSLASLMKNRYKLMLASLGAALSFHVLIGIYAGFCTLWVVVIEGEHRRNWKILLKNSYIFFLAGFLGVYAVIVQLFSSSALTSGDIATASHIYVTMRVPHHVYPPSFGPIEIWGVALLKTCIPLVIPLFLGKNPLRQFAIYILSSLALVGIGLAIHHFGKIPLLKYYWFRYPATMIPLGYFVAIASMASMAYRRILTYSMGSAKILKGSSIVVTAVLTIALVGLNARYLHRPQFVTVPKPIPGPTLGEIWQTPITTEVSHPLRDWIQNNTSKDDIFLVDPQMDSFYVVAERARVVSFKHSPQSEKDILEWYRRLLDISGLQSIDKKGFACGPLLRRGYCQLSENQIAGLAEKYNFKYVIHRGCRKKLNFPVALRKWRYTIYRID